MQKKTPPKNPKIESILKVLRPKKPAALKVFIDFPAQEEGIVSGEYTFRIGTVPEASKVEVSIDRGPWLDCRSASGYWWYEWSGYAPGVHRLTARAVSDAGEVSKASKQRRFQVLPG